MRDELEDILNSQIAYHAPLGHESEVAWSIWGSIIFQTSIDSNSSQVVSKMDDSVVALLALDANERGLFQSPIDDSKWSSYMTRDSLYGPNWLLSYEANIKNWISYSGRDFCREDSRFGYLKRNKVQFYDKTKGDEAISPYAPSSFSDISPI
jgi:hypothetical protein